MEGLEAQAMLALPMNRILTPQSSNNTHGSVVHTHLDTRLPGPLPTGGTCRDGPGNLC